MKTTHLVFSIPICSLQFCQIFEACTNTFIILIFLLPSCIVTELESYLAASSCQVMCALCLAFVFFKIKFKNPPTFKIFGFVPLCNRKTSEFGKSHRIGTYFFPTLHVAAFVDVLSHN